MRLPALFLALLFLAVVGSPTASRAEKVKTNQSTSLLSRPGERGKVILTLQEGKKMKVIAKDGRWLKVNVSGRTGWVPRSKVDVAEDEIARNTRRRPFVDGRGKGRGFGGEAGPDDRIGADAVGNGIEANVDEPSGKGEDDEDGGGRGGGKAKPDGGKAKPDGGKAKPDGGKAKPDGGKAKPDGGKAKPDGGKAKPAGKGSEDEEGDAVVVDDEESSEERPTAKVKAKTVALADPADDAEEAFAATPSTTLYLTGNKKGKYTEVETDEGDLGYVLTSSLQGGGESSGGGIRKGGGGGGDDDDDGGLAGGARRGREIDTRARLGVTFVSQTMSPGGGHVGTSAATLAIGGGVTMPYQKKFIVGGELTYDYAKAIPGVKNPMGGGTTSIGLHNLRLRALGGYDMKKPNGMALFGRLGFHYQSYQVGNVGDLTKNTGKLPSEIIKAPALGFGIEIPRLTKKIGVHGSLDAVLFSSVSQTKRLEDGASPAARGALFEAGMTYRWRKDLDIVAAYDLTYFAMSFGAPAMGSMRPALGGNASRSDQFHVFSAGVGKAF